jgi:hypothetical protein
MISPLKHFILDTVHGVISVIMHLAGRSVGHGKANSRPSTDRLLYNNSASDHTGACVSSDQQYTKRLSLLTYLSTLFQHFIDMHSKYGVVENDSTSQTPPSLLSCDH